MTPSTALATVLVDELVRCGVREVVLAPGSRSAPLAYAVLQAERAGHVRLHVRVDERSAGFLALGLAKLSRRPAVVVTTSGTAVANLHPAVLEAHHAAVPLIVLSADRPDELRGTGANQTTVHPGVFAGAVRWEHDLPAPGPGEYAGAHPAWRSRVDRAWAAATGALGGLAGPVHLNVGFRDPLAPELSAGGEAPEPSAGGEAGAGLPQELAGRPDGAPWTAVSDAPTGSAVPTDAASAGGAGSAGGVISTGGDGAARGTVSLDAGPPTLLVLGDLPSPHLAAEALAVAVAQGWPVVAEPFGAGDRSTVLPHGSLLLTAGAWLDRHAPERVVVVGRCTLNRETGALLRRPGVRVEAVTATGTWPDPSHVVERVHEWSVLVTGGVTGQDHGWAESWRAAGAAVASAVTSRIGDSWPSGPAVAHTVLESLADTDLLVLGSSNAARDVDRVGVAGRSLLVTGNRGLAGIDGTNATAVGVALAAQAEWGAEAQPGTAQVQRGSAAPPRVVALVGDLTFLHDLNGLLIGPDEPRPDLTVVVVNDDGGGIFTTLEYGTPDRAAAFERVFGTPTGADLSAACTAYGVAHERVAGAGELADALAQPASGIRVVEVAVPRAGHRDLRAALAAATADALG